MEPLQNEFTLCSWVKSLQDDGWTVHTWLSYATELNYNEIMIGDNGNSFLFDIQLDPSLRYHFTDLAGRGIWYHYCTSWSFSSKTQKFYLNGNKIGETTTPENRKLGVGGYLAIGGDQDSYGGGFEWFNRFGGELYKLNFFSKELTRTEVKDMARDMCREVEETYGEIRQIKWEEIVELKWERKGNVTDIKSGCGQDIDRLWELLHYTADKFSETVRELEDTNNQLNKTTGQLSQIRKEKAAQEKSLQEKEERLKEITHELEQARENSSYLAAELEHSNKVLNKTLRELESFLGRKDGQTQEDEKIVQDNLGKSV